MKKLFGKGKIIQILGIFIAFALFSTCGFCAPCKRTYVGWDKRSEIRMPHEENMTLYAKDRLLQGDILEEQVDIRDMEEQVIPENTTQKISIEKPAHINRRIEASSNAVSEREDSSTEIDEINNEISKADTVEQRTEPAVFQPIDDSHIPLKWEYKMKEE